MKSRLRIEVGRRYHVLVDRVGLLRVPQRTCSVDGLRFMSTGELRSLFSHDGTGHEWRRAETSLNQVFPVADGQTWGVNPGDRRAVWYLIKQLRPASVLEVGTHVGASTVHIASALRSLGNGDGAGQRRVVTVDIEDVNSATAGAWKRFGLATPPRDVLRQIGCDGMVQFVTQPSVTFLDSCKDRFDFIFLDGDHAATTVYNELSRALNLLTKDGVVLLHDYFPRNRPLWSNGRVIPGPHVAVERLRKEGARLDVLPLGELPWPTKLGSHKSSLALVVRGH